MRAGGIVVEARTRKEVVRVAQSHYTDEPVRRYGLLLLVSLCIFAVEFTGGHLTGSLALMADAWHVFSDNMSIIVALSSLAAVRLWGANKRRADLVAAGINLGLIAAVMLAVFIAAIGRLSEPPAIESGLALLIAIATGAANVLQHYIHERAAEEHRDHTHRTVGAHILKDLKLSIGVVAGLGAVELTGITRLDPLISMGVVCWILWGTKDTALEWWRAVRHT